MIIYVPKYKEFIVAVEGTGDNLFPEDEAEGFVDYVMTSIYHVDGEEIVLEDGGQMLSKTLIADLEEDELVSRVLDYWGLGGEDWIKGTL